jgi:type IV secretory pathway protease TraF
MSPTAPRTGRWRPLVRLAWIAAGLALLLGLVRVFVLGVYRVDSASMEPYLHGDPRDGEWVAVLYRRHPALERFDPLVVRRRGEPDPVIKRVGGLPKESVQLSSGDLLIDGARLPAGAPRLDFFPVYDSRFEALDEAFQLGGAWQPGTASGEWRLDGSSAQPALDVSATYARKILDERLGPDGARTPGRVEVGDAGLELELSLAGVGGSFGLRLSEENDFFDAALEPLADGRVRATITRRSGRATAVPLGEGELAWAAGLWRRVRFTNFDNRLELRLDCEPACLSVPYDENSPMGGEPDPSYRHLMPRAAFWASGLTAEVRSVRVLRDQHYTERGNFGVRQPLQLGPDELYLLGDNSSESLDSRELGPFTLEDVLGVPLAVVWPPSSWRVLKRPGDGR